MARLEIEPPTHCSARQDLNHSTNVAPLVEKNNEVEGILNHLETIFYGAADDKLGLKKGQRPLIGEEFYRHVKETTEVKKKS